MRDRAGVALARVALVQHGGRALRDLVEPELDVRRGHPVLDHPERADVLPLLGLDGEPLGLLIGEEALRIEDLEHARDREVERRDLRDLLGRGFIALGRCRYRDRIQRALGGSDVDDDAPAGRRARAGASTPAYAAAIARATTDLG
jgi:hypothetical protein